MSKAGATNAKALPNESYLRKCMESQTLEYVQQKSGCFNVLAVGEDGLGKTTFLEMLFNLRASGLREAKKKATQNRSFSNDCAVQVLSDRLVVGGRTEPQTSSAGRSARPGAMVVNIMTTVNYCVTEANRQPWNNVVDFVNKQVQTYVNGRAANPIGYGAENDQRIHCCLYFLPPLGPKGLRRCDRDALRALQSRVNLIPVLAKADCYSVEELQERKAAVAADIENNGVLVHQYMEPREQQLNQPLAVIGASYPDFSRTLPWGTIQVEDENVSDVAYLRKLIVENYMLIMRKSTKKLHVAPTKAATLPRK